MLGKNEEKVFTDHQIKNDIEAFLARGGVIEKLDWGAKSDHDHRHTKKPRKKFGAFQDNLPAN